MFKTIINLSIIIFVVIFILITQFKPYFLYNKKGCLRVFGLGKNNSTIIPLWLLVIIIAIISYLIFIIYLNNYSTDV